MNLERTKPETLAAAALDLTPSQSLAAHEYAERLNAALARLGLTDRLTLPPAPNTAIDELPAVVDVPLRKTLSVLMGKAQQGDASALATLEWTAQVAESIFAGLHARDFAGDRPLALPSSESLATLAQGVDALLPRKISNGAWSLPADGTPSDGIDDGVSLVRLLCSDAADSVTELKDDNEGWVMTKALSTFPNAEKILLGCREIVRKYNTNDALYSLSKCKSLRAPLLKNIRSSDNHRNSTYTPIFNGSPLEEVDLSELQSITGRLFVGGSLPEELNLPKLTDAGTCIAQSCTGVKRIIAENVITCTGYSYHPNLISGCPDLEYAYIPNLSAYTVYASGDGSSSLQDMPKLSHLVIGKAPFTSTSTYVRFALDGCPNLVLLDIRGGLNQNIYLDHYNPTSVLSDSERLPIFLSNFKTYIAERLTDNGSGKTLTLSQAVRDAIEGDPTIAQIITSKGWTISPAPTA